MVTYETLTTAPQTVLNAVYDFIGAPRFAHDVNNVVYDEGREFDARMGTPGLHSLGRAVRPCARPTILPPELFRKYEADSFWRDSGNNPRGVPVI